MKGRLISVGAVVGFALSAVLVGLWVAASVRTREITVGGSRWELAIEGAWLVADNQPQLRAEHDAWALTFFGLGRFDGPDATMSDTTPRSHWFAVPVPAPATVLIGTVLIVASLVRRKDRAFRASIPNAPGEESREVGAWLVVARAATAFAFFLSMALCLTAAILCLKSERRAQTARIIWGGIHYEITSAAGRLRIEKARLERVEDAIITSETNKLAALRQREERIEVRRALQWTTEAENANTSEVDQAANQMNQERALLLSEFATAAPPLPDMTPFDSRELRYSRVLLLGVCIAALALGIRLLLRSPGGADRTQSWAGRRALWQTTIWALPLAVAALLIANLWRSLAFEVVGRKQLWSANVSNARLTWNNDPQCAAESALHSLRSEEIARVKEPLDEYNAPFGSHRRIPTSLPQAYVPLSRHVRALNSQTVTSSPPVAKSLWLAPLIPLLIALALLRPATVVWRVLGVERRRRRGLCSNCAYDLRGSAGCCPECGTLIPQSVVVSKGTPGLPASAIMNADNHLPS